MKFEEIKIGMDIGSYEYKLTLGRILKYQEATDDLPDYASSLFSEPVAPATICDSDLHRLPKFQQIIYQHPGSLHAKQEYEFLNPACPGKRIKVTGRVADKYVRRGRAYVIFESISIDEDNRELLRARSTICWTEEGV